MRKLFFIFTLLIIMNVNIPFAYSLNDIKPPTIHSVNILEKTVQTGEKITIEVNATDDISGISSILVYFKAPTSNQIISNNVLECEVQENTYILKSDPINQYAEIGIWNLDYVLISDFAGNSKIYSVDSGELNNVDFKLSNSTPDTLPPVINSIEVVEKLAGPGNQLTVKINALDDVSGISHLMAVFKAPTSNQIITTNFFDYQLEGNTYIFNTDPLLPYVELGMWNLDYIMVSDHAGNNKIYSVDLDEIPNVQFKVSTEAPKELQWTSQTNVALNKNWKIELSSELDVSSLSNDTVFITNTFKEQIPVTLTMLNETTIIVSPINLYLPKNHYQLNIKGLEDINGVSLNANVKLDFVTTYD